MFLSNLFSSRESRYGLLCGVMGPAKKWGQKTTFYTMHLGAPKIDHLVPHGRFTGKYALSRVRSLKEIGFLGLGSWKIGQNFDISCITFFYDLKVT